MEKELNLTESLKHGKLYLSKIVEKKEFEYEGPVYDIKVANKHSYSIDNLIVHNSSAASLIFYLLDITRVDPIQWNFPFERFINDKKTATDSEKIRIELDDGRVLDLLPKEKIKLADGSEIEACKIIDGMELNL